MVTAKRSFKFEPDFAIPPGETLAETLVSLGMSQRELAVRTDLTEQTINRIIKGSQPITFDTASKLELATGVPASFWNRLEANYRERIARQEERSRLTTDVAWLKTIPFKDLVKRNALSHMDEAADQVREVLRFFGVASVAAWHAYWDDGAVAARCSQSVATKPGPTSAWLRLGELKAHQIDCQPFDKASFRGALEKIREMTVESPSIFVSRMSQLCAESGVALCLVPELPGAPWYGASKWLTPTKAMILLGLRGRRDDQFWFSFFHEAGHVLLHSKKDLFLSDNSSDDPREQQANSFASDFLIPAERRAQVMSLRTKAEVKALAEELGIAPGIVVGQYQHLTRKFHNFNDLKVRLEWSNGDADIG